VKIDFRKYSGQSIYDSLYTTKEIIINDGGKLKFTRLTIGIMRYF
jgi:hypothetical protein